MNVMASVSIYVQQMRSGLCSDLNFKPILLSPHDMAGVHEHGEAFVPVQTILIKVFQSRNYRPTVHSDQRKRSEVLNYCSLKLLAETVNQLTQHFLAVTAHCLVRVEAVKLICRVCFHFYVKGLC